MYYGYILPFAEIFLMDINKNYAALLSERRKKLIAIIKFTLVPVAVIMLLLAVALIVDLIGVRRVIKLEAGSPIPSAASVSGHSDARYDYDDNEIDLTKVGEYNINIIYPKFVNDFHDARKLAFSTVDNN